MNVITLNQFLEENIHAQNLVSDHLVSDDWIPNLDVKFFNFSHFLFQAVLAERRNRGQNGNA